MQVLLLVSNARAHTPDTEIRAHGPNRGQMREAWRRGAWKLVLCQEIGKKQRDRTALEKCTHLCDDT